MKCTFEVLENRFKVAFMLVEEYEIQISVGCVMSNTAIYSDISEAITVGLVKKRENMNGSVEIVNEVIKFVENK